MHFTKNESNRVQNVFKTTNFERVFFVNQDSFSKLDGKKFVICSKIYHAIQADCCISQKEKSDSIVY